jgi:hypothetical protein
VTSYRHYRERGYTARRALYAARIDAEWESLGGYEFGPDLATPKAPPLPDDVTSYFAGEYRRDPGHVRVRAVLDECPDIELMLGTLPDRARDRELSRIYDRGVWTLCGEYWDGESWQVADSCGGFIGADWRYSGYDTDIMAATIDAYRSLEHCPTCHRPTRRL